MLHDRHKTIYHLSLVFGHKLSLNQKRNVSRDFFVNTGKNLADIVRFERRFESEIRQTVSTEGMEHLDAAYRRGKGVIGITGHIGNFELLAAYIAGCGYRTAVIGRALYQSRLDSLIQNNRRAVGLTLMATTDSPRKFLRWLSSGGVIGVLIDVDSTRVRSQHVPMFGRPANTPIGQTILGLKAGAAFVPIVCVRRPGNRYKIIVRPEIQFDRSQDLGGRVREITGKCNQALEEFISLDLAQWTWFHNRWHTRPEKGY